MLTHFAVTKNYCFKILRKRSRSLVNYILLYQLYLSYKVQKVHRVNFNSLIIAVARTISVSTDPKVVASNIYFGL